MSDFRVEHAGRDGSDEFAPHNYRVLLGDQCVALISMTHRGDEHFLQMPSGEWEAMDRLIEGGGPEPLRLTKAGLQAIQKLLGL